jgi:hypothetical protein
MINYFHTSNGPNKLSNLPRVEPAPATASSRGPVNKQVLFNPYLAEKTNNTRNASKIENCL